MDRAEELPLLPEEQCGYRRDRGTLDLVTLLQCATDAFREAGKELHVAFVDLRKAFDSVNREAMYQVLGKLGVPPLMLQTIKGLHDGMKAQVSSEGALSDSFEVRTGVRQGCCLAPILFSLYFAAVINDWKANIPRDVILKYRLDGNLHRHFKGGEVPVHQRTHVDSLNLLDMEFADDLAVLATTADKLDSMVRLLFKCMADWGFTMSDKT